MQSIRSSCDLRAILTIGEMPLFSTLEASTITTTAASWNQGLRPSLRFGIGASYTDESVSLFCNATIPGGDVPLAKWPPSPHLKHAFEVAPDSALYGREPDAAAFVLPTPSSHSKKPHLAFSEFGHVQNDLP